MHRRLIARKCVFINSLQFQGGKSVLSLSSIHDFRTMRSWQLWNQHLIEHALRLTCSSYLTHQTRHAFAYSIARTRARLDSFPRTINVSQIELSSAHARTPDGKTHKHTQSLNVHYTSSVRHKVISAAWTYVCCACRPTHATRTRARVRIRSDWQVIITLCMCAVCVCVLAHFSRCPCDISRSVCAIACAWFIPQTSSLKCV